MPNSVVEIKFIGLPGCGRTTILNIITEFLNEKNIHYSRNIKDAHSIIVIINTSNLLTNATRRPSRTNTRVSRKTIK